MTDNPALIRACGYVGLIGALLPIGTDVISWIVADGYNPVAQSISRLAVGPSSWLMDAGLWAFVLACIAVVAGMWNWRPDGRSWTAAVVALVLLAAAVGVVARVNQYAGTQNPGANLHLWAVCFIAVFFAVVSLAAVPGLGRHSASLGRLSLAIGIAWLIITPIYWFFTDQWSGAVERLLALLMIGWLVAVSRAMLSPAARGARAHAGHPSRSA